jgi:prepilin-type N-terminal cleavage/methylation domain-containing protein
MIQHNRYNHNSGFTLIETAVVLIIIALLMGASLKGQQLINVAKEKQLEADFENIPLMIYSYQDKFKAIPGDDKNALSHLSGNASNIKNGDGEGMIAGNWFDFNPSNDNTIIWQHLRLAGLMSGETDMHLPDYLPKSSIGKAIDIHSGSDNPNTSPILKANGTALKGTYIICARGISGDLALSMDIRLDDGNPSSGSVLVTLDTDTFTVAALPSTIGTNTPSDILPDGQYIICMGV